MHSSKLAGLGGGAANQFGQKSSLSKPSISNGSSLFIIFTVFSFGIPRVFMKQMSETHCAPIPWFLIHPRERKRNS
jgi:hypothetical protein